MRKFLITGAAGFIPSSLAERLLEDENNLVVGIDNFLTGKKGNLPQAKNFKFIKADVNSFEDLSAVMLSYRFDYVFHYAAVVGVKRTLENPLLVLNDINGIKNILHLCKNTGVTRIFFSSSSEVYGEPVEIPQNEHTTPLNSKLPYAIVKNVAEAFIKSYHQEHGLNYTIFRFFNTYGPKQSTDFVLSKFIKAALENKDITIYGDGMQTRTFCFIDDNIDATIKSLSDNRTVNKVINLGSDKEITILDLANLVIDLLQSSSKIVHCPPLKEGDMQRRCPDNRKMLELLGRNLVPLEEGVKKTIRAMTERELMKH
ncbi:MAG: NAD-dependent epimerase/dehydratase family protein [Chitinophagaceae bacterium]|nr:NAD-dependent epimerase/dehydratase family protein [Chitinophagaceae bacterium]